MSEDWGGVRELAAHYVQLISKEQRHGPYFLGGYSYGGLLAYEIASLLTEQKQRVEFVAMIDTFPWFQRSRTVNARLASIFMRDSENLQRQNVEVRKEVIMAMVISFLKQIAIATYNGQRTALFYLRRLEAIEHPNTKNKPRGPEHF